MVSSSVSSGHPDKYSNEIPHEDLLGWGNLLGRIISIKRNHYSNLEAASALDKLHFQKFIFFEAVIFTKQLLFQSETSTEQPLFENRKFFMLVTFQNNYHFCGGIV